MGSLKDFSSVDYNYKTRVQEAESYKRTSLQQGPPLWYAASLTSGMTQGGHLRAYFMGLHSGWIQTFKRRLD
jgi:hypothetical protein